MTTWGIVSTIKAPMRDVLDFAAWHLELGAHRLFIHLDAPDAATFAILKAHPRIRPLVTDDDYWHSRGRGRPEKVEPRQTFNATRTYRRRADVDWLVHIDVDEFLIPTGTVAGHLALLPEDCHVARLRPMEALAPLDAPSDTWNFKTLAIDLPTRHRLAEEVWPTYGRHLNGGFLSHVAGKVAVRTGLPAPAFRIHNFLSGDTQNPGMQELPDIALAHLHARSWEDWRAHYDYRHRLGAYRAELKPNKIREKGGLTMHEVFAMLEDQGGDTALRQFFDEVCAATPGHLSRLRAAGLLRQEQLPLTAIREKHFPGAAV
ncbi:glycosyltransferase family 2 protein [Pseudooceanicola onchidii]|uniref:glycosyltransferase family 2 protein n=1 Tax=Pseudooceanicola onchidii TaxID=2562279 RepID=UPI0010AAA19E|nr:glycosyltransferase family 2 protein [Pseudooceanicola onchidii]